MATSIGKLSKSFFVKLLVGIIILPFVFWGMGDVFRGGNQNVIATIDSKKINTQELVNYLNRLNLNDQQIKNLKSSDLLEKILSEFIGKKVMSLEIEKFGIIINDNGLGFSSKNLDDLLKPYFTTKSNGTGLGLPIVNKIINDHNGTLKLVENKIGATIKIDLPFEKSNLQFIYEIRVE